MTEEQADAIGIKILCIAKQYDDGDEREAFRELLKLTAQLTGEIKRISNRKGVRK